MHFNHADNTGEKIKSDVYWSSTKRGNFYMNDFTAEIKSEVALNLPPRDELLLLYEANDERTTKAIIQIHSYTTLLRNKYEKTSDRLEEFHFK